MLTPQEPEITKRKEEEDGEWRRRRRNETEGVGVGACLERKEGRESFLKLQDYNCYFNIKIKIVGVNKVYGGVHIIAP